jgi:hypothetical protein
MKKSTLILGVCLFLGGAGLSGCNDPAEKVQNAEKNVTEANKELEKASEEYRAEVEIYRKEATDKIAANNKSLIEFNTRIALEKQDAKADYQKKLAKLEQRNTDMKKRMEDYKAETKEEWDIFRDKFDYDMKELDKDFKDATHKKTK